MKFKQFMGWAFIAGGLVFGYYKAKPLLSELSHDGPEAILIGLLFAVIILAIVRILRY